MNSLGPFNDRPRALSNHATTVPGGLISETDVSLRASLCVRVGGQESGWSEVA